MKRISGTIEIVFDFAYLLIACAIGAFLIFTSLVGDTRFLAGVMALILAFGDTFHLAPRIMSAGAQNKDIFTIALGRGKQITSITMTFFYILLWHIGVSIGNIDGSFLQIIVYFLAVLRIVLCFLPQNQWTSKPPSPVWGIYRNVPFFIMGLVVSYLYKTTGTSTNGFEWMWLAIIISFACYLPVVIFAHKKPAVGMLMLPKTCAYIWMLWMCLSL